MKLHTASHSMTLPDGKAAPDWVHLLPAGTFSGADGRGPYHLGDAAAVIAASMAASRLPVDENHATDLALKTGAPAPAQAWITELQSRADGIWGRAEWTAEGARKVTGREYRGISPVYEHDAGGRVIRLLRAGLTNAPNLTSLTTLHHQRDDHMDHSKLAKALGLPADADDAAILAAIAEQRTVIATHAADMSLLALAAGAAKDAKPDAIVTALQAQVAGVGQAGRLAADLVTLQTQLVTLTNDRARERATLALDAAGKEGKLIAPALREHYIARHMADPAGVQKELDAMPSLHAGGFTAPPVAGAAANATPVEANVAAMMSINPLSLAKTRDARIAAGAGAV